MDDEASAAYSDGGQVDGLRGSMPEDHIAFPCVATRDRVAVRCTDDEICESIAVDIALTKSALAGVARRAVAQLAEDRGGELGASEGTAARIVASRAGSRSFSKQCPGTFSQGLVSPWRLKEIKSCQKSPGIR